MSCPERRAIVLIGKLLIASFSLSVRRKILSNLRVIRRLGVRRMVFIEGSIICSYEAECNILPARLSTLNINNKDGLQRGE